MAKFTFTIQGNFETEDSIQALLQLSHLAEITKINIGEKFKLQFTNINVNTFGPEPSFDGDWIRDNFGHSWTRPPPEPFHFHPEPSIPVPPPEPGSPEDIIETYKDVPSKDEKVVPLQWKDKMQGEGMPVD